MHALHAAAVAGHSHGNGHAAKSSSSSGEEHRALHADAASSTEPPQRPDAGTQVTFSPSGLKVLEDAAVDIAGTAKEWVHDIGDAAIERVGEAVETTVGYAALAALAGGALLNGLV